MRDRDRGHAAPDGDRLARRRDRLRLARCDQLPRLRRLRDDRRASACSCAGSRRTCCCPRCVLRFGRNTPDPRGRSDRRPRARQRCSGSGAPASSCGVAVVARDRRRRVIVARYIAADPFEYDIKQLRSEGDDAIDARTLDAALRRARSAAASPAATYIAADRLEQVPPIVDALRTINAGVPAEKQTIGRRRSILDVVPDDQEKKLAGARRDPRACSTRRSTRSTTQSASICSTLRPPDELARDHASRRCRPSSRERLTEKDGRIGLPHRGPAREASRRVERHAI